MPLRWSQAVWAGSRHKAASPLVQPVLAAKQFAPCHSFSRKKPQYNTWGGSPVPSFPSCTDLRSLCFASCSHREGSVPRDELCAGAIRAQQGCQEPLKPFKYSKGIPRASLQISASPALSAGSGVALLGEKPSSWSSPPSPPDEMPPWDGGRQPGSCQQPSRAVRRHRAPDELKLLPFKERQRLRHPGTKQDSFCRLPTAACTWGPCLAVPDGPHSSSKP